MEMTMTSRNKEVDKKQQLIRLIHVAKSKLALDDDTYRAMLMRIGGKKSSAEMSVPKLLLVLEHLKESGFKVSSKTPNRPMANDPQSKMIRGLWLQLAKMGVVRNSSEAALAAFVERMTKVSALQWLSTPQASQVIEHLKEWRQRVTGTRAALLLKTLQLPPLRLAAAQEDVVREAVIEALGHRAALDELDEDEFQAVLKHFNKEVA